MDPTLQLLEAAGLGRRKLDVPVNKETMKPQAIATKFTTVINDISEFKNFGKVETPPSHPTGGPKTISLDHSGYIDLIEETYSHFDQDTRLSLPLSVFTHYCNILLHQRYANVYGSALGHSQTAIDLNAVIGSDPFIPKPIAAYLNAIGEFIDPNGRHWLPGALPAKVTIQQVPGLYGRVGAHTHNMYSTCPSPGVTLLSVLADVAHTDQDLPAAWNLPPNARPVIGAHAHLPSTSLLGYRHAVNIGSMSNTLNSLGFNVDWGNPDLPVPVVPTVTGVGVTRRFIVYVSKTLATSGFTNSIVNVSPTGSQSILGWVTTTPLQNTRPTLTALRTNSYSQLVTHRAAAVPILKLRVFREDHPSSYCYAFEPGHERPEPWLATLNARYQAHDSQEIAQANFGLNLVDGLECTRNFVLNILKRS